MAALRSLLSSTIPLLDNLSSAISTIPTAPSTIYFRAATTADACWRWSMALAISGA